MRPAVPPFPVKIIIIEAIRSKLRIIFDRQGNKNRSCCSLDRRQAAELRLRRDSSFALE